MDNIASTASHYYDLAKSYVPQDVMNEIGTLLGDSAKILPFVPLALNVARIGGLAYKGAKWLGRKLMSKFNKKKLDGVK